MAGKRAIFYQYWGAEPDLFEDITDSEIQALEELVNPMPGDAGMHKVTIRGKEYTVSGDSYYMSYEQGKGIYIGQTYAGQWYADSQITEHDIDFLLKDARRG